MTQGIRLAAAFNSDQELKNTLHDLNAAGFNKYELSVLLAKAEHEPPAEGALAETHPPDAFHGVAAVPAWQGLGLGFYPYQQGHVQADAASDSLAAETLEAQYEVTEKDPRALLKDAATGGVLGALAGAASSLLPGLTGLGLIVAGPIAAATALLVTGAAIGTGAGALIGIFKDEGLPLDKAHAYRESLEQGFSILIIENRNEWIDDHTHLALAYEIIERHQPRLLDRLG